MALTLCCVLCSATCDSGLCLLVCNRCQLLAPVEGAQHNKVQACLEAFLNGHQVASLSICILTACCWRWPCRLQALQCHAGLYAREHQRPKASKLQSQQQPCQRNPSGERCLTLHVCQLEAGSGHAIIEDIERPSNALEAKHVVAVGRDVNFVHHLIAATRSLQARTSASLEREKRYSVAGA